MVRKLSRIILRRCLPLTSCQRKEEISHNLVIQISLNLLPTSVIIIIKKKTKNPAITPDDFKAQCHYQNLKNPKQYSNLSSLSLPFQAIIIIKINKKIQPSRVGILIAKKNKTMEPLIAE